MGKLKIDIISLSLKVKTNICRVIFLSNNCTNYGHPMIVFFSSVQIIGLGRLAEYRKVENINACHTK